MKYKGEEILNLPNILSAYRLFSFPFIVCLILLDKEQFFFWIIIFNLFTDVLDGLIARRFKLQTNFGSRLDSLADAGMYVLVALGIIRFRWDIIMEYHMLILLFFGVYLLRHTVSYIKFKKFAGLHLTFARLCFLLQAAAFIVLFKGGPLTLIIRLTVWITILAFLEEVIVLLMLKEHRVAIKGLYHLLEERKKKSDD